MEREEKKVVGYIFWLSEYLSRQFQVTDLKQELENAIKDAVESFAAQYHFDIGQDYTDALQRIYKHGDFRRMRFFKFSHGKPGIKTPAAYLEKGQFNFSGVDEVLFGKLAKANELIRKAFDTTMQPYGKPSHIDHILAAVPDNMSVTEAQCDAFIEFISTSVTPLKRPLQVNVMPEYKGKIIFPELIVDLNQDTDLIVTKFKKMIVEAKSTPLPYKGELLVMGDEDRNYSFKEHVLATIESYETKYAPKSDEARAVGLWLWDFVLQNGGSVGAAIRAARANKAFKWFADSPERVLERHYAKTRECIERGAVLPMSGS